LSEDLSSRWGTPVWTITFIGSLWLSLLHASISLARIAAQSRWWKAIHFSAGTTAALLTALRPQYGNIAEAFVLQGVLED